jgi:hypothetical protein
MEGVYFITYEPAVYRGKLLTLEIRMAETRRRKKIGTMI